MKIYEEPLINHIDVKITYACNYRCEYCYQVNADGQRQQGMLSKENAENLLHFVDRMKEKFQVTFAGGEPFVYPYLDYLIEGFVQRHCKVRLITNFSASLERIQRIVEICGEYLEGFNISIHLSQWKCMAEFYDKLEAFCDYIRVKGVSTQVNLTCVVTDENFEQVKVLDRVLNNRFGYLNFKLHRVYCNGIYHLYKEDVESYLRSKNIDVPKERANHINFYGRMCWSGSRFFYIESNGDVMRCYSPQQDDKLWHLGNLCAYEDIQIFEEPKPCRSKVDGKCICHRHFENNKLLTCEMEFEDV